MNDELLEISKTCSRRVMSAVWDDDEGGYLVTLPCGHAFLVGEHYLHSPVLCEQCMGERLAKREKA